MESLEQHFRCVKELKEMMKTPKAFIEIEKTKRLQEILGKQIRAILRGIISTISLEVHKIKILVQNKPFPLVECVIHLEFLVCSL